MNRGVFLTPFSDITPCHIPPSVAFTLLYIDSFFSSMCSRNSTAMAHAAVTRYPVTEKRLITEPRLVPVLLKNVENTFICKSSVSAVTTAISSVSMARSVTTVPRAFANDTPSYLLSTPHLVNSPMRGITRLAAYERNTELTDVLRLGCSPIGSRVCLQRQPRNICASMPKGNDSNIHVQSMPCINMSSMLRKSKSRYIQYKIAPPNASGSNIFIALLMMFLISTLM